MSTPVYHDGYLLIGGLMMKLDQNKPGAVVLWPESRATARRVLSDTSTALFRDGYIYSARSFGEFVCLDAKTGKQLWETDKVTDRKSGASVHPTENGKSVLLYNDRGELIRAQLTSARLSRGQPGSCAGAGDDFLRTQVCVGGAGLCESSHLWRTNKELVCASLATKP